MCNSSQITVAQILQIVPSLCNMWQRGVVWTPWSWVTQPLSVLQLHCALSPFCPQADSFMVADGFCRSKHHDFVQRQRREARLRNRGWPRGGLSSGGFFFFFLSAEENLSQTIPWRLLMSHSSVMGPKTGHYRGGWECWHRTKGNRTAMTVSVQPGCIPWGWTQWDVVDEK